MLGPHPRILKVLLNLRTPHLNLIRLPAQHIAEDAQRNALEIVKVVDEIEGAAFLELAVFGPRADGEGEDARLYVDEALGTDPGFEFWAKWWAVSVWGEEGGMARGWEREKGTYPGSGSTPS
jgi:hypothetical protein